MILCISNETALQQTSSPCLWADSPERWLLFFISSCRLVKMEAFDIGGYGGAKCFYKQDGASRQRLIDTNIFFSSNHLKLLSGWAATDSLKTSPFSQIFRTVKHIILLSISISIGDKWNLKYSSQSIKEFTFQLAFRLYMKRINIHYKYLS